MRLDMISRRRFLKSAGVAALAVAAAGVLAGCDGNSGSSNGGSGNVTPAPVPGATEDVTIIFFDENDLDEYTQQPKQIGTATLKNVLKTADHVNTNDIPEELFPACYHVEKAVDLEIRNKDGKKYIYVFVTNQTPITSKKEVEVALKDMTNPTAPVDMKVKVEIAKDATEITPREITLPDGYAFYLNMYEMDQPYTLDQLKTMVFVVVKV